MSLSTVGFYLWEMYVAFIPMGVTLQNGVLELAHTGSWVLIVKFSGILQVGGWT